MPAKAGIQVRDSAHGEESEDERTLRHASEGWHPECATAHTPDADTPQETAHVVAGRADVAPQENLSQR